MKVNDLILVSVDDHVVEPPDMFKKHLPASLQDRAPQFGTDEAGNNFWTFEDRVVANVGLNAVAGRVPEEYGCEPTSYTQMREGTWDIHKRIEDMNANGILGSICFGTFVSFDGGFFIGSTDKKLAYRMLQAYNDWHIDDWAGTYPGRIIPMAMVPQWDVDLIVEELHRVRKKGCRNFAFTDNPAAKGLPSVHSPYWEPMWQAASELEMTINCHIGTGVVPPYSSPETPIDSWIVTFPMAIAQSAGDWLYLQALMKYPNLKISLSEGGIGWVPYFLERADFTYRQHKAWTHVDFGGKLPSDVFKEHFVTCFIEDRAGIEARDRIGVDLIAYECDYPHSDCVWPNSPEFLLKNLEGLSDEEINKITHLNAFKHYHYDPFPILGRENCTVGALRARARHVDIAPRSYGGQRPLEAGQKRVVTQGDVAKLFRTNSGEKAA